MLVSVLYMDAADPGPVELWIRLNSDPHHCKIYTGIV